MSRVFNFSAGPAALPDEVRQRVAEVFRVPLDFAPSIVEVSHRGPRFAEVAERLQSGLRRLMGLDPSHAVLLMHGGAHLQFAMLPMNLAHRRPAAYLVSGHWSEKALAEAGRVTETVVAGSSAPEGYTDLPELGHLPADCAYLHYTGNETVDGVQYPAPPAAGVPLAADLSSEFLSRPYAYADLGLAYGGAQKNLGVAGLTVVVIRADLMERIPGGLPAYLDYRTWAERGSMNNTPCTFAWFVAAEMVDWIDSRGGLAGLAERNRAKAQRLYGLIDGSDFYTNRVSAAARSEMNVPFFLPDADLEPKFVSEAETAGLIGLKGHRAVGGLRASLYNGLGMDAVEALAGFMGEFERRWA